MRQRMLASVVGRTAAACRRWVARFRPVAPVLFGTAALAGCVETVVSVVEVATIEVSPSAVTLTEGDRTALSIVLKDVDGHELTGRSVTWSVEDPQVATVDAAGVVEARAPGTTRIYATSEAVQGSAEVSVTPAATIQLSTTELVFAGIAGDAASLEREIEVANGGSGSLRSLSIEVRRTGGGAVPWLEAQLRRSSAPTSIRVEASSKNLPPGAHDAVLTVRAPAARNTPVDVRVRLNVVAAPAGSCDLRNRTVRGDVEIAENQQCTFTNVRIRGNLEIRRGAVFTGIDVTVDDDIKAEAASRLTLSDARVKGDVEVEDGGSLDMRRGDVRGNVKLESNHGSLRTEHSRIDGSLQVFGNRGGPFTIHDNTIRGNLQCKDNSPLPTGGGNDVKGSKEDQCSNL